MRRSSDAPAQSGLYNPEQSLVRNTILAGAARQAAIGLGIGIERLCMAATGARDISLFQQSAVFCPRDERRNRVRTGLATAPVKRIWW